MVEAGDRRADPGPSSCTTAAPRPFPYVQLPSHLTSHTHALPAVSDRPPDGLLLQTATDHPCEVLEITSQPPMDNLDFHALKSANRLSLTTFNRRSPI